MLKNPSVKAQLKREFQWEIEGSVDMTVARVVDADKLDLIIIGRYWYCLRTSIFGTAHCTGFPL